MDGNPITAADIPFFLYRTFTDSLIVKRCGNHDIFSLQSTRNLHIFYHWLYLINISPRRCSVSTNCSTYFLSYQVHLENAVHVTTGDVRVNGAVVLDTDKTNHVTVKPQQDGTTEGRVIKFKQLVKGFSKEVKLTR